VVAAILGRRMLRILLLVGVGGQSSRERRQGEEDSKGLGRKVGEGSLGRVFMDLRHWPTSAYLHGLRLRIVLTVRSSYARGF